MSGPQPCTACQVAFAEELIQEYLVEGSAQLLEPPPGGSSSTAGKMQPLGILQGLLYTVVGLGSTLGGSWEQPHGSWAVVGQVGPALGWCHSMHAGQRRCHLPFERGPWSRSIGAHVLTRAKSLHQSIYRGLSDSWHCRSGLWWAMLQCGRR